MNEKEILNRLEQLRDSTQEAIKWLDIPSGYRKNVEALDGAIQLIKEHRKSNAKIRQLQRSLRARQNRAIRAWRGYTVPSKHPFKVGA